MDQRKFFKVYIEKDDIKLTTICELIKTRVYTINIDECFFEDMVTGIKFSSLDNYEEINIYKALEILKGITGDKLKDYTSKIKYITKKEKNDITEKNKNLF